jgi:N-methylhydantoinase B
LSTRRARRSIARPIGLDITAAAAASSASPPPIWCGAQLTAFSPDIKERMDTSCAIFDGTAQFVARAKQLPVHLGSMLRPPNRP